MRCELCRIDEDADYDAGVLGGSSADEGEVASMERAHGGYEGNTARGEKLRATPCAQRGERRMYLQWGYCGGEGRGGHD